MNPTTTAPQNVQDAFRLLSSWAEGEGYSVRITKPQRARRKRQEVPVLTDEQLENLYRAVSVSHVTQIRSRAMIALLDATGLRVGELAALRVSDLELHYKDGIGRVSVPCEDGCKSGHRVVPFRTEREGNPTRVAKELTRWLDRRWSNSEYLFNTSEGQPITRQAFTRSLHLYAKRAGIPKLHAHMFRHTYATRLVRQGVDLPTVQALLGHANAATTANTYLHTDERRLEEVARSM